MPDRSALMQQFLIQANWGGIEPISLAGDASARRYFRVRRPDRTAAIVMDAPLDADANTAAFLSVARLLTTYGLSAPQILAQNQNDGFILLEDFGDALFSTLVNDQPAMEMELYSAATDVLVALNRKPHPSELPNLSAQDLAQMIEPAFSWYRRAFRGDEGDPAPLQSLLQHQFSRVAEQSLSLRDFHAENLIWLPDRDGLRQVGLLDFQDAMIGPRGYDLASLLMDARRDVPQNVAQAMITKFTRDLKLDRDAFSFAYALIGVQRNLRILGVFTRLALKENKTRYLDFIPRVWRYVEQCLAHPDLGDAADQAFADIPAPTTQLIEKVRDRCESRQMQ